MHGYRHALTILSTRTWSNIEFHLKEKLVFLGFSGQPMCLLSTKEVWREDGKTQSDQYISKSINNSRGNSPIMLVNFAHMMILDT